MGDHFYLGNRRFSRVGQIKKMIGGHFHWERGLVLYIVSVKWKNGVIRLRVFFSKKNDHKSLAPKFKWFSYGCQESMFSTSCCLQTTKTGRKTGKQTRLAPWITTEGQNSRKTLHNNGRILWTLFCSWQTANENVDKALVLCSQGLRCRQWNNFYDNVSSAGHSMVKLLRYA